jgi:signal peptidase I
MCRISFIGRLLSLVALRYGRPIASVTYELAIGAGLPILTYAWSTPALGNVASMTTDPSEPPRKPTGGGGRSPFSAIVLTLLLPGLGHVYDGRVGRGALLYLLSHIASLAALWTAIRVPVARLNVGLALLLGLATMLAIAWDAGVVAARAQDFNPKRFNRWYVYLALFMIHLFLAPVREAMSCALGATTFRIPTGSMEPTVLLGDRVIFNMAAYGLRSPIDGRKLVTLGSPSRGELVAYKSPADRNRIFLHRVIALAGERVEIRRKSVYVNDRPLDEPYAHHLELTGSLVTRDEWGPQIVPEGYVFILGDNRENARDSRFLGFVPTEDVLGRAACVYWSFNWEHYHALTHPPPNVVGGLTSTLPAMASVRWQRIGHVLR